MIVIHCKRTRSLSALPGMHQIIARKEVPDAYFASIWLYKLLCGIWALIPISACFPLDFIVHMHYDGTFYMKDKDKILLVILQALISTDCAPSNKLIVQSFLHQPRYLCQPQSPSRTCQKNNSTAKMLRCAPSPSWCSRDDIVIIFFILH